MSPAEKALQRLLHRTPFPAGARVCIINSLSKAKGLALGHSNADSLPDHKPHVADLHAPPNYRTDATKKKERKTQRKQTKKLLKADFLFLSFTKKKNPADVENVPEQFIWGKLFH